MEQCLTLTLLLTFVMLFLITGCLIQPHYEGRCSVLLQLGMACAHVFLVSMGGLPFYIINVGCVDGGSRGKVERNDWEERTEGKLCQVEKLIN